jgi:predicted permease
VSWWQRLLRTERMERDLDAELRFHLESQVADKMESGMSEAEARRTTRLEFGGLEQVKQDCRESRGTLWVASIAQDLRFGARILAKSPAFSAVAILVLALGIGVSTLSFSLYNLIALQSIPVHDPSTIVRIERRSPENVAPGVPYASIAYYGEHAKSLSAVITTMSTTPMVLGQDEKRIVPAFISANYFAELGAPAVAGRLFDPATDNSPGGAPVAVLGFRLWQTRFQGDPSIVGKSIVLDGRPATVIGVVSPQFANLGTADPDVFLPVAQHSYFVQGSLPLSDPNFDGMIFMWGRLAPGASPTQAEQELLALTNRLREVSPALVWEHERIVVEPGAHFFSFDDSGPVLALVALLVVLILTIACANLGGLLLARGVSRQREILLRFDLGASKWRVFRQLVTENLLLGFLGSIAALPLSYVVLRVVLVHADAPAWMSPVPDWRVVVFTLAMGLIAAILFGLLPTLRLVRRKNERTLWNQFVVSAQVAASCVLIILAGLLVRATLHVLHTDPGFGYEQVLSIDPELRDHGYTASAAQSYLDQLQGRLRLVPGVTSVSLALSPPLITEDVRITGIMVGGHRVLIYPNWVSPEFFQTMGIPLLRGRYLKPGDTHAVVVSESLARKRWPNEDPIGRPWKNGKDIVVGVVGNTRAMELNNTDATEIYFPPTAERFSEMSVLVKTAGAGNGLAATIKEISGSIDPGLFPAITPLKAGFRKNLAQVEQVATIVSLLGGVAIFLAVVGLLGLVSYAVSRRTREIAIRLAVGAKRTEICIAVLHKFVWPVCIGLATGVALTAALSQVIRRGLYGISGRDPISYVGAAASLIVILFIAALFPMRRAFRLDIARILHSE